MFSSVAYLISNIKLLHIVSLLHNLSHKFVPADEVRRTLQMTPVEVQVATAQSCRRDFEDGIGGLLDVRIRAVFDSNLS